MTTLKELKAKYPGLITTSGNTYNIDGLGIFKQKNTVFGIMTYTKDWDDSWIRTDFNELAYWMNQIYG